MSRGNIQEGCCRRSAHNRLAFRGEPKQALSRLSWLGQAAGPSWFCAEAGVLHCTAAAQRALREMVSFGHTEPVLQVWAFSGVHSAHHEISQLSSE